MFIVWQIKSKQFLKDRLLFKLCHFFYRSRDITSNSFISESASLIVVMFSTGKRDFNFDATALQISPKRNNRESFFSGLSEQFQNFAFVHEKLFRAKSVPIEDIPLFVRTYMHAFEEKLAIFDNAIRILKIHSTGTNRLDFRTEKSNASLESLMNEIIMPSLTIFANNPNLFFSQAYHLAKN